MRVAKTLNFNNLIQECIPVGCVLPAAVAVCWGGGVCLSACWDTPRCGPGNPPSVGLETPLCGPGDPPGCGLETPPGHTPQLPSLGCGPRDPQARPLNFPLGCGPEDLQGMLGYHPWRLARHAGIPPAVYAGIPPPLPCEQNDRQLQKFYLAPNFRLRPVKIREEKQ